MGNKIEVIHGDCIDIIPTLNQKFNLLLTDPPYGNIVDEKWDFINDYYGFTKSWLSLINDKLLDTASLIIWCSIGEKSSSLLDIAKYLKENYLFKDMIVWNKQRGRGNRRGPLFTREEILWATKTKDYIWNTKFQYSEDKYHESWIKRLKKEDNPYKRLTNVWNDILEPSIEKVKLYGANVDRKPLHPTEKPLKAIERIINLYTNENDWILDCFGGSGTTALACKNLNRNCVIIEKEQEYIDNINKRIE